MAVECLACASFSEHPVDREISHNGKHFTLKRCEECGSRFYDPLIIPDYTKHTDSEVSIRDYVEQNAGVESLVTTVVRNLKGRRGRLLDIGCAYGFATDAARRLLGWDVLGVEPSTYGRRGAAALGVPMLHEFIDVGHPVSAQRFDVIFASEVIEHLERPADALNFWRSLLTHEGSVIFTTPDSDAVPRGNISESQRLAVLSPGAHTILFSKRGMEVLLERVGFIYHNVQQDGVSLTVAASPFVPVREPDHAVSSNQVAEEYMRLVLDSNPRDPMLIAGMRYRLFKLYINHGNYEKAEQIADLLMPTTLALGTPIKTYEDFLSVYPVFAPWAFYGLGILALNHRANPDHAYDLFMAAFRLAVKKIEIVPSLAIIESHLLSATWFHAALAAEYSGKKYIAKQMYSAMRGDDYAQYFALDPGLLSRADQRLLLL